MNQGQWYPLLSKIHRKEQATDAVLTPVCPGRASWLKDPKGASSHRTP